MDNFAMDRDRGRFSSKFLVNFWLWFTLLAAIAFTGCAQTAKVVIRSTPEGAEIYEANIGKLGTTNLEITMDKLDCKEISTCKRSFVFKLPGYEDVRIERQITGPTTYIHAYMKQVTTRLRIKTHPANAKVTVHHEGREVNIKGNVANYERGLEIDDEQIWGGTNQAILEVKVSLPGYESISERITLIKGEDLSLEYILKELIAVIDVKTAPTGVDVYDRYLGYLGRTPFSIHIPMDQLVRTSAMRDQVNYDRAQLQLIFKKPNYVTAETVKWINIGKDYINEINMYLEKAK
jgi:hypothetical protein